MSRKSFHGDLLFALASCLVLTANWTSSRFEPHLPPAVDAISRTVRQWDVLRSERCPGPPPQQSNVQPAEYASVKGWQVWVGDELAEPRHADVRQRALAALSNHLQRVTWIMPEPQLSRLRSVKIRVDFDDSGLKGMQYHPNRQWLVRNGHDPRLEKHVHIPQAADLYARHMWAKHPYVVLHELAHAYHDQVLGFDDPEIQRAYRTARDSGKYDAVLDHRGKTVRHYGMNNAKEYFAESTEAWFGVNDFYPFVRAELKQCDPQMYELLAKIWGPIE